LVRANSNRVERVYPVNSSSRWNRRWGLRVQTREGVWYVSDKTRQPTHGDLELVESSQTMFDDVEDQTAVFRTTKGWIARAIREERCVAMFSSARDYSHVLSYLAYQLLFA